GLIAVTSSSCKSDEGVAQPKIESKDTLKLVPHGETKVSLRQLPHEKWGEEKGSYPFISKQLDMSYGGSPVFETNVAFPEFYIDWEEGEMETDPAKNRMVQDIKNKWEGNGKELYGFKISREFMVGYPL